MAEEETSLIEYINIVLKNRRLVLLIPLIVFLLIVGYTFIQPRTYSSYASFVPQSPASQSSLTSGLAAQFGISMLAGEASQTPAFYADLIQSREILRYLADKIYTFHDKEELVQSGLAQALDFRAKTNELLREKTIEALEEIISVTTDRETGLVTLTAETYWAEVSQDMVQNVLDLVNRFNLGTRQIQATAERQFVEGRLAEVSFELRASEDTLQVFLQKNRQWQGSPELGFIHDRLQRDVIMRQQIFTSLNQAYEQARIDEVRDTPLITIVERPEVPVLPDRRGLLRKGILALLVGSMLGILAAFGKESINRERKQEADKFAEFETLRRATLHEFRRPWRFLWGK
ncbi:Wzz/FepE/Etk N-terminal domain-containing protein [Gemmatimonadota bacterium]